jgi:hypothetical protein
MRPWQPDLFTKTPAPKPLERRHGRPCEPDQKGFRGKRKPAEMSEKTVLALAEWANSQPATLRDPRPLPAASGPLNRKENAGTDTGGGEQGPDG